jgi:hypothetical protein
MWDTLMTAKPGTPRKSGDLKPFFILSEAGGHAREEGAAEVVAGPLDAEDGVIDPGGLVATPT